MYTVVETLQAGWTNTHPGGAQPPQKVNAAARGATTEVVFGNKQDIPANGTIRVFKYSDLDSSGGWVAGEPGLANWTFTVKAGETTVGTITTGSDGIGTLSIAAGIALSRDLLLSRTDEHQPGGDAVTPKTVTSGQQADILNFGNHYTPPGVRTARGSR
jgi:hypothetical protein